MAAAYIHFNDQLQHGRKLRRLARMLGELDDLLAENRDGVVSMRDGAHNGGDPANYAVYTTRLGFATNAEASAAAQKVEELYNLLQSNGSITNLRTAINNFQSTFWG